jgi:hypothetical protein
MGTAMIYGVYSAAFGILVMLVEHFTGLDVSPTGRYIGFLGMIGLIVCMVMAMKTRRDEEFEGKLTYGQGVGTGTLVALASGVILAIYTYIHMAYIAPEMVDYIKETTRTQMLTQFHGNQAQVDQAMGYATMWIGPVAQSLSVLIGSPLIGVVFALIISIFMKTKPEGADRPV